jgi:hypothetical protein
LSTITCGCIIVRVSLDPYRVLRTECLFRVLKMMRENPIKEWRGMEHLGTGKEDWIAVGFDDDGTKVYLDAGSIVRDLEPGTRFKVYVMHVPPQGSEAYRELLRLAKAAKKNAGKPAHVKQVLEIDFAKDASRNLHVMVCDDHGGILNAIDFHYPDWVTIERGSIIDKVRDVLFSKFPDATGDHVEPLKFTAPKVHVKPERIEISKRHHIDDKPADSSGKLKLEEVDL